MNKVNQNIKQIFSYPLLLLKKFTKDTFVNGLIFGAIFSLVVNIITIQIQKSIQKQRIYEALENEILTNSIMAAAIMNENDRAIKDSVAPDYYHPSATYNNDVWGSQEALKYIVQLDPDLQAELFSYYNPFILQVNETGQKDILLTNDALKNCYTEYESLNNLKKSACQRTYYNFLENESDTASSVHDWSEELLEKFHPTKDRLKNPILRLIMGKKAIGALAE
ncbi:MAG: hypothetical protein PHT36_01820 [Patescibacteria group bacterium]|nr:hypothetical protein [Patescibacteria group bacterium]